MVTQSHNSMGFNLRPFENTFWNLIAALKCACIFGALWLWLYHHAPVMARVFGRTVFACGSICKIDLCLDIFGPYNCWENLFCQINCPRPPDPRFQIFSQFPDSRFFGLQFPDSIFLGLYSLIPDADSPPPPHISKLHINAHIRTAPTLVNDVPKMICMGYILCPMVLGHVFNVIIPIPYRTSGRTWLWSTLISNDKGDIWETLHSFLSDPVWQICAKWSITKYISGFKETKTKGRDWFKSMKWILSLYMYYVNLKITHMITHMIKYLFL